MKKILTLVLVLTLAVLSVFSFTACKDKTTTKSITVAVPDGGPALGMAYLMKNYSEINGTKVTYKIVDGSAGIKSAVMSGEADVAIMPTNMASILFNSDIDIKLVGTNSYGLLYMLSTAVSADEFSLDSLKGEVLNLVGQGGTPEIVVKKILESAEIEYVESDVAVEGKVALKFHSEGSTVIGGLKQNSIRFAVLGEPAVSTALQKVGGNLAIVADLQECWKTAAGTSASYPQTALVAKGSLIESDRDLVIKIAKLTVDGALELKKDAKPYIDLLKDLGATVPDTFGSEGVLRTNIEPSFGSEAKADVEAYFEILKTFKAPLIGGKLPADDFYFDSSEVTAYASTARNVAK